MCNFIDIDYALLIIEPGCPLKGILADARHTAADGHGGQTGTAIKSISADARHAVRDVHGSQTGTTIESTPTDARHAIENSGVLAT